MVDMLHPFAILLQYNNEIVYDSSCMQIWAAIIPYYWIELFSVTIFQSIYNKNCSLQTIFVIIRRKNRYAEPITYIKKEDATIHIDKSCIGKSAFYSEGEYPSQLSTIFSIYSWNNLPFQPWSKVFDSNLCRSNLEVVLVTYFVQTNQIINSRNIVTVPDNHFSLK